MKKTILAITVLAAALVSCQNDNRIDPRPLDQILGPVTVTGRVRAELNTNTPGLENVSGLTIVAVINRRDFTLNPVPNTPYADKYYYATTNASGEYTLNLEAGPNGSGVVILFPVFRADVTGTGSPVSSVFNSSEFEFSILKGRSDVIDHNY